MYSMKNAGMKNVGSLSDCTVGFLASVSQTKNSRIGRIMNALAIRPRPMIPSVVTKPRAYDAGSCNSPVCVNRIGIIIIF